MDEAALVNSVTPLRPAKVITSALLS